MAKLGAQSRVEIARMAERSVGPRRAYSAQMVGNGPQSDETAAGAGEFGAGRSDAGAEFGQQARSSTALAAMIRRQHRSSLHQVGGRLGGGVERVAGGGVISVVQQQEGLDPRPVRTPVRRRIRLGVQGEQGQRQQTPFHAGIPVPQAARPPSR
ncbi:hypothetical protein [Kutzneria kofuensis]|uniref:hypothetical protein n=1 Tax=Kutzneria kofuensis TaxID=103725 RepID=UPI003CD06296